MTSRVPIRPTISAIGQEGFEGLVGSEEREQQVSKDIRDAVIEDEEAEAPKVHPRIYSPSPEEYNKHCATHLPYRNWCPICVQAKRKNPSHRRKSDDVEKHIPVLSMDYMYMNEIDDENNLPILVIHDSMSEGVWAMFVKRKGNYSEYVSKKLFDIVNMLGYSKIVLKSDQEPAIKDLMYEAKKKVWQDINLFQEGIKAQCTCQVTIQHSPVGESQSNGVVENAIQGVQGQIRAIKLDVESNSEAKLTPSHPAWPWLIQFAAQTIL